jgi:hypothetical protein
MRNYYRKSEILIPRMAGKNGNSPLCPTVLYGLVLNPSARQIARDCSPRGDYCRVPYHQVDSGALLQPNDLQ